MKHLNPSCSLTQHWSQHHNDSLLQAPELIKSELSVKNTHAVTVKLLMIQKKFHLILTRVDLKIELT